MPFAAIATPESAVLSPSPKPVKICLITPFDCLKVPSTALVDAFALLKNPLNGLPFNRANRPPRARPAPPIAVARPPAFGMLPNTFLMPSITGCIFDIKPENADCTDFTTALTLFLNVSLLLYKSTKYLMTRASPTIT